MKNVLQKLEDDDLMYEDNEPKFEELRFKDLLDISFIKMIIYQGSKYFSNLNCHIGLPSFVYHIHIFLTFMQLISPCFILNSTIIWKSDSTISFIFQIIFAVSRGWYSSYDDLPRRVITIVCVFFILIFDLFLEYFKRRFQSRQHVSDTESSIVMSIYKYFLPHLYPFLLLGFPGAVKNISNGDNSFLNYFDVIIAPLFFIFELFKYYNITERVLFENHPSFSLNSIFLPLTITIISVNNLIDCSIIPSEKEIFRLILLAILFIIYLITGIIHMILIPYVSLIYSYLFSSVCLSCSVVSLICLICIILNVSIQFYLLIIFVILTLIFYFINLFITHNSIIKYSRIFEEISCSPDEESVRFDYYFKNKLIFYRSIQISLHSFDPNFITFKPFRLAYEKWPESEFILIMWAKIVSIFPTESSLFGRITTKIIPNPKISLNYRLQFRYILNTRITTVVPSLKSFFVAFDKASIHTKNMYKLFFENVLSKNTLSFWKNIADITKQVERLDFAIKKNLDEYPNNIEVNLCYYRFLKSIKLDPIETIEMKKKIELLRTGKKLKNDLAYISALPIYPQLSEIGSQSEELAMNKDEIDDIDDEIDDENENEFNFKSSLSSMIKSSKIGRITIPSILILIGTILALCGFFCFLLFYRNQFVNYYYKAVFDVNEIDDSILSCSRLEFFVSQLITLLGSNINRTELISTMAPSLTGWNINNNVALEWTFNINKVISLAHETRNLIEKLPNNLNYFDIESSQSYSNLFIEKESESSSVYSKTLNSIDSIIELLENSPSNLLLFNNSVYFEFTNNMNEFYPALINVSYQATSNVNNSNAEILEGMNNIMALSLLLDLLLISIPFVFCYFYFGLISYNISQSFLSLQVTSVVDIINNLSNNNKNNNKLNSNNSIIKNEEAGLNRILPAHQRSIYSSSKSVYITLLVLTFLPIVIPSFVIYFLLQYLSNIEYIQIVSLQHLTRPVSIVYYLAYLYTEVYNSKYIYKNEINKDFYIDKGKTYIKISNAILKTGLFGNSDSLNVIEKYASNDTAVKFHNYLVHTELENLLKSDYLSTIDLINSFFVLEFNETGDLTENDDFFYQISFYLTCWAIEKRDTPFFTSLFTKIKNNFKLHFTYIVPLFVCVAIIQVIVVVLANLRLLSNQQYFKSALNFFLFFKPSLIVNNEQITKRICEGGFKSDNGRSHSKSSEKILINIPEAVVILDKKLNIVDHNKAFNKLVAVGEPLCGKPLTQFMLYRKCSGFNIGHLERRLNSLLRGKEEPNFDIFLSFLNLQKKPMYVKVTVVSLSQEGSLSNEIQYKQITSIALVIDDQAVKTIQSEQIKNEQFKIKRSLQKVIPLPIVEEISNSVECLSFSAQSVAIGNVYVETDPFNFSVDGYDAPFKFYDDIFTIFDECLKSHPSVTKLKAISKIYTFSCGLFDDNLKKEKMARDAALFALSLIKMQRQFEEKVNRRISLCIGIECSGPVVAGFVSLNRPNFMVIGDVAETSHALAVAGIPGKVQISENVQELIDGYNFNIQERGENILINERRTKTFFVTA